jgi:hypothetical protein
MKATTVTTPNAYGAGGVSKGHHNNKHRVEIRSNNGLSGGKTRENLSGDFPPEQLTNQRVYNYRVGVIVY